MSTEYMESSDESDGSSDNESQQSERKRLSTESSTADDEFGLRRKSSMSSDMNSPNPVRQRSVSSDLNQQGYYSPPPIRSNSISSDQEGMGYYSPPPVISDSERKNSLSSDTERKYSVSSDVLISDSEAAETADSDCSESSGRNKSVRDSYYGGTRRDSQDTASSSKFSFYQNSSEQENRNSLKRSLPPESDNRPSNGIKYGSVPSDSDYHSGRRSSEPSENDDDEESCGKRQRLDSELSLSSEVSTAPSRKYSTQSESSENNFGLPTLTPTAKPEGKLYSNVAERLMQKMGHKEGTGLGKDGQGIVEPIQAFKQEGRRGLGLKIPSLDVTTYRWNADEEVIQLKEDLAWLSGDHLPALCEEDMHSWTEEGARKLSINNETKFCSPSLLKNVLQCKTVFDDMDGDQFFRARNRSNPWEHIKNGPFLNRAAMKMANMDQRFDMMFTDPRAEDGSPLVKPGELLYFADVCAGPGGFSEYILFRKKWRAKGIGFTLTGSHDFKLDDFFAGPSESFEPYYGVHGDGDVYNPENIMSLHQFVLKCTKGQGVHFMMADGGFSVEGQENIQEILSKRLYLCQFLVSLYVVRPGGHFVCKVFDLFTPFSAGLLYLLYRSYKRVCVFKPNTSRPANSERYIVCKWKRPDCAAVRDYLFALNKRLDRYPSGSKKDIVSCVPLELMTSDDSFYEYLVTSNNIIAERQVVALAKVRAFYEDRELTEPRQAQLKEDCYRLWKVPLSARKASSERPEDLFQSLTVKDGPWIGEIKSTRGLLNCANDLSVIEYACDWHYVAMGSSPVFYLGLGKCAIYRYNEERRRWMPDNSLGIQLSPGTLLYGELVEEFRGSGAAQVKVKAFHIIDAYALGEQDISRRHYTERRAECEKYVESLTQYNNPSQRQIRVKTVFDLERISRDINRIQMVRMKNGATKLGLDMGDGQTAEATGLIFIKATKEPWIRALSRSQNKKYFNNPKTRVSLFEIVPEACASFVDCMKTRRVWKWDSGCGMKGDSPSKDNPVLHREQLLSYVECLMNKK